jgi:RNA polymerase sigma-70 factor (ECF subfamily)
MPTHDFELLERWRAGDRDAGNELFERHRDALFRFFHNKASVKADDLVQDTMLACLESQGNFEKRSHFRSYLFGVARFQLYAYYRKHRRDGEVLDFNTVTALELGASPSTLAAEHSEQKVLLEALRRISLEHQVVLELCYWEELSAPELAEILEIDTAAVYSRIRRAKQQLKRQLDELSANPKPLKRTNTNLERWAALLKAKLRKPVS